MINDWENIIAYLEEFKKVRDFQTILVCSKYIWVVYGAKSQENLAIVTLKQNCDINMNISFS